jgi:hypothetical protein
MDSTRRDQSQVPSRWLLAGLLLSCALTPGCVSRRLTILSQPAGALVEVDGERLGLTPVSMDFTYYGVREITLSKPGYETLTVQQPTPTPWYQVFPLEFFSDNFALTHLTDAHVFRYQLAPENPQANDVQSLNARARNFRTQAQLSPN